MTRDVLIRLSGLQAMEGDEGTVEVITSGDYFWKNNKHYLIYDEVMEGMDGAIRNTMKLTPENWRSKRVDRYLPVWYLNWTKRPRPIM